MYLYIYIYILEGVKMRKFLKFDISSPLYRGKYVKSEIFKILELSNNFRPPLKTVFDQKMAKK